MQEMISLPPTSHHGAEETAVPQESRCSHRAADVSGPADASLGLMIQQ